MVTVKEPETSMYEIVAVGNECQGVCVFRCKTVDG